MPASTKRGQAEARRFDDMAVLAHGLTEAGMIRERSRDGLAVEIFADLPAAESLWRTLEASPGCLATPYQRFDWVAAFATATIGPDPDSAQGAVRVVVLRDPAGHPLILLPLHLTRGRGGLVARVVGDKHANLHLPVFASHEAAATSADRIVAALVEAGRAMGVDAYALDHQPRFFDGAANPLALGHPCPSNAYGMILGPDPDATLRRLYKGEARKKMRAKERKLVEALGPVEFIEARSPEDVASVLSSFYAQKAVRMASMGFHDPYADPAIRRFLELGAQGRGRSEPAPLEIHALRRKSDRHVLATFAGAVDRERFSGMWNSFDTDPDLSRFSLGEMLLMHLIATQTAKGRRAFDLGVGEARYKANICEETIDLVETVIPVTLRGQAFALWARTRNRLKRQVKRSPRLVNTLQRMRHRAMAPDRSQEAS